MKELYKKHEHVISYLFFGVLTTVVNIVTFKLLTVAGVYYLISNGIAWIVSVLFAYVTNKKYVFKSETKDNETLKEMGRFFFARITSLVVDMAMMFAMVSVLFINEDISKIVTNIVIVIINYVLSKIIVFKK